MFLAFFCNHQYSCGKAVAVNHVPPTQCVIVMSCIRLAYVFVTSRKVTIWHAFSYFISGRPLTLTHNHHFTVVMQVNLQ